MNYTALYRKFRPQRFEDVCGQDAIVTTLKNQIAAGRIGHAYLFCGTRGTGKTSIAKIFARAVNCEAPQDGSPCGVCPLCTAIAAEASMNVIEIDAASHTGVDNVRMIIEEVTYSPVEGKYKVYIIDEVHMISTSASNALLKTLEEPPAHAIFILATTDVHKVLGTIISRCQRYDFRRITVPTVMARLAVLSAAEGIAIDEAALSYIAKAADGSLRDAISLLDQCVSFYLGKSLTYDMVLDLLGVADTAVFSRLFCACLAGDAAESIAILDEAIMLGRELSQFILDFTWYLRNILLIKATDGDTNLVDVSATEGERLIAEAAPIPVDVIMRYIRVCSELTNQIRFAANRRILVETALIKLCRPEMESDIQSLMDRIRRLEEKLERGVLTDPVSQPSTQNGGAAQGILTDSVGQSSADPSSSPGVAPNTTPNTKQSTAPNNEPLAPSAADADISKNWPGIRGKAPMPLRSYLKNVDIKVGDTGTIIAEVRDTDAYAWLTRQSERREQLKQLISAAGQKTVEIEFRQCTDAKTGAQAFESISGINMPVEIMD